MVWCAVNEGDVCSFTLLSICRGVEYVVKSVAERLVKKGHDVTVLCGGPSLDDPREEWINDVHVFRWLVWSPGDAYHIPRMRGKLKSWLLNTIK